MKKALIAVLLILASTNFVDADDYELPPRSSSLAICQLKAGERVVIMRADDLMTLTTFADKNGVAVFPEVPDGFWAIVEGTIWESWQKEEIALFFGRAPAYNCYNIKKSLRGSQ